jgi:ribosomal protein S18 acetylase RimI-like enzyme
MVAVVDDGASIGYLPPMDPAEADDYWSHALGAGALLFVTRDNGRIVGTVQLRLELRPNGDHRAEIAKLMVHPDARRRGLARALMLHAEQVARDNARTLLVLDTREGDPSNALYQSLGWAACGRVPRWCKNPEGGFDATIFYLKDLANEREQPSSP